MKINCKCGRVLKVTQELAGKKIKCKSCGQKYRLPPSQPADPTMKIKAWGDEGEDAPAKAPSDVGAVALGEKLNFGWVVASIVMSLVTTIGGVYFFKFLLQRMATDANLQAYAQYIYFGMLWGPALAFVASGWIVARFSPGRTIAEPAIGAALAIAGIVGTLLASPGILKTLAVTDQQIDLTGGDFALKVNVFLLGMFVAACLACAGAYFGEVAQERTSGV